MAKAMMFSLILSGVVLLFFGCKKQTPSPVTNPPLSNAHQMKIRWVTNETKVIRSYTLPPYQNPSFKKDTAYTSISEINQTIEKPNQGQYSYYITLYADNPAATDSAFIEVYIDNVLQARKGDINYLDLTYYY